jgi:ribosomal protein S6
MSKYEFTFLLPEEAEVEPIKTLVESLSGKISEEQKWGKRQLSYPIQKKYQAFYFTWMLIIKE